MADNAWAVTAIDDAPAPVNDIAEPFTEDHARDAIDSIAPGATITSQGRTPTHNAAVGGVPNSMHLDAQASDVVLPEGVTPAQFKANLVARGFPVTEFLDEGTHVHWGWGPKGGAPANDPWAPTHIDGDPTQAAASDPWAPTAIDGKATAPNDGHWHNTPQENADLDAFIAADKTAPEAGENPSPTWIDTLKSAVTSTPARWKQMGAAALMAIGEHPPAPSANITMMPGEDEGLDTLGAARTVSGQKMAAFGRQVYAGAAADVKANMPNLDDSTAKRIAFQVTSGTIDMLPVLAGTTAAIITRNPAVIAATTYGGAAYIAGQAGASKYGEARASGRSADQASMDATFTGISNGALAMLPLGVLMKPGGSFLAQTLKGAGAFGAISVVTEALQLGYDKGLVTPDMTWAQAWPKLVEAGIVGTLQGALLSAGHAGLESAVNRLHAATPPPAAKAPYGPPQKPPPVVTADAITAHAKDRLAHLDLAAKGDPDAKMPGPDGKMVSAPVQPRFLSRDEIAERAFLRQNADDPAALAKGYQVRLEPTPGSTESAPPPVQTPPQVRPNQPTPTTGPVHADIRSSLGLDHPGIAPEPDPWAPAESAAAGQPSPAGEFPKVPPREAAAVEGPGIPRRALESDVAVTATGREVPVQYALVEASHLVPSQTQEGNPNPDFPAELQPRDRTRAVSQAQIASIAQNINPRLLDRSVNASDGAPIVAPSGVVESGNGRSLAIQRAYAENLPSATQYRNYLAERGYPVDGMEAPVLVRIRSDTMPPEDRQAFVREANQSGHLGYSATERAMSDAAALPDHALGLYRGGDIEAAGNRDFVRAFMMHAMPTTEHGAMVDTNGNLSLDGARRVRAALLAKAYADPDLVGSVVENADSSVKAIGGALTDASGGWAAMRDAAGRGEIPPALDQTSNLLEAVKLVARARQDGRNVAEFVGQPDIFTGQAIDPDVEAWLRLMFRNTKDWTQPVGRDKLAEALSFYAREAQKAHVGVDLLGQGPVAGADILKAAKARQYGEQSSGPGPSLSFGEDVRTHGEPGAEPGFEGSEAGRGAGAPSFGTQGRGAQVRGDFGPAPASFTTTKVETGPLTDLTHEARDYLGKAGVGASSPVEKIAALANWVAQRGRSWGQESFASLSGRGDLGAASQGERSTVKIGPEVLRRLADPAQHIVSVHNHPSNGSFSGGDTATLAYPGHAGMVVVGHEGDWHAMALTNPVDPGADIMTRANALTRAQATARDLAEKFADFLHKGNFATDEEAEHILNHVTMRALEESGLTHYLGPDRISPVHREGADRAIAGIGKLVREQIENTPGHGLKLAAPGVHRPAGSVHQLGAGIADILSRAGRYAGFTGSEGGAGAGAGRSQVPGKPVQLKLLEDERRYTETPEFKSWFGDSKVVDANGKPLRVYHGTKTNIETFAPSRGGEFGSGIYFADRPETAGMFGSWAQGDDGLNIIPAYISLKNPLVTADRNIPRNIPRGAGVKALKKKGYDGVIGIGATGDKQYVVFDPEQIKSAIGNRGTFDPNDPSILHEDENRYERDRPPFYSALTRSIEESKLNRATAKDWSGLIDNLRAKGGVPGDDQLSLFEDARRYDRERDGAVSPDGKTTQELLRESATKEQILGHIAQHSDDSERRHLARVLSKTIGSNITYRHMRASEAINQETGNYRAGFYDGPRNFFTVHADLARDPEKTFLHEAVHAATVQAINHRTPTGKEINKLFDAYHALSGSGYWHDTGDQYGFRNPKEFIAEALSNPKFRAVLDSIKAAPPFEKSMLQKLYDTLRKMFGLKPADPMGYIVANEPKVFDPKTVLGGAARETLVVGKSPYEPVFGQDESRALFEDPRRYGEIPRDDREALERAARTGNWIGRYGAEGASPDSKIRTAIAGAFKAWERAPRVVPEAVRTIFGRLGGGGSGGSGGGGGFGGPPEGFRDIPTSRPTEAFSAKLKRAADAAMDLVHDAQMLIAPMAEGTAQARATAKDFANMMRLARWHGQRMMEGLKKNFDHTQLRRMWEAADEESVLRQEGKPTAGKGLSTLTPEERRAVLEQQADAQNVWKAAQSEGMVEGEGLPSFVPRMMVEMAGGEVKKLGSGEEARSIPGIGRNLKTSTPQMKHRKYLTTEETETAGGAKFGTIASVVRDIRTLPLATMRLREAVAGRALINKIKEIGQKTGEDTVVEGHEPAGTPYKWFTLDHPAFKTWRPKLVKNEETGKYEPATDQNGDMVFEKVPLYVRGDFEGPLRAVLSLDSGKVYNGLMSMKGRAMTAIMYSPLIHNAVEWGRALPAMPGKVITLRIYFEGNRAKRDPATMTEAIMHGLVPIGHQAGMQDVTSIANVDSIKAGRSWTAKIVGAIPGIFSRDAQDAVYRTIDKMGDVWHNTLLWDRVGDLQMGLYTNLRDHLIKKGATPDAAQYAAAHFSNRYAGALPLEAMSTMSRKIANLALFSRTYTLGNLGAMKDVLTGLPRDVQAQIGRSGDLAKLKGIRSLAARKALAILATDIALFYAGNSILQSAVSYLSNRQDLDDIEKGYVDRLNTLLHKVKESPLELLNPFADMQALSATSENEPGRENRVLVGYDHNGTAIYARNPVGKIGEEFTNWLRSPIETGKSKFSTFLRPTWAVLNNDAGFGRKVYDPKEPGYSGIAHAVGNIVSLYLGSQIPLDSLKSAANVLKGQGSEIDTYKVLGPLGGVTFSKGAPGGPGVGELFALRDAQNAKRAAAMPDIIQKIKNGDIAGARADMRGLGISPGLQNYYVRVTQNPRLRLSTRSARELLRQATPEERARILQPTGTR